VNPWDDDGERPPRELGWGCLAAVIIGSVTSVIAVVIIIRVIAATYPW
jgi:hypothetical protein